MRVWMGVPEYQLSVKNLTKYQLSVKIRDYHLTLEEGQIDPPLNFYGFKFLLLDRLTKALLQLFFVRHHISWL